MSAIVDSCSQIRLFLCSLFLSIRFRLFGFAAVTLRAGPVYAALFVFEIKRRGGLSDDGSMVPKRRILFIYQDNSRNTNVWRLMYLYSRQTDLVVACVRLKSWHIAFKTQRYSNPENYGIARVISKVRLSYSGSIFVKERRLVPICLECLCVVFEVCRILNLLITRNPDRIIFDKKAPHCPVRRVLLSIRWLALIFKDIS